MKNKNLNTAKAVKNDEFYTQINDIGRELHDHRDYFKDKVVLCNCDDPESSHFWKYFALKFEFLGLKKLVSTHLEQGKPSYKLEMVRGNTQIIWADIINDVVNGVDVIRTPLKQNGDFRSPECIELLKEADIVVTNPPFSLFREYITQLIEYNKEFIIIGSQNAITYKEIFALIKANKIWLGNTQPKEFKQPDGSIKKFGNICWFTNLEVKKRHEDLILCRRYYKDPNTYPTYDNYDAINVDKLVDIPMDYAGVMGVPITFIDKYNPEQFEVLGHTHNGDKSPEVEGLRKDPKHRNRGIVCGEEKYARILIRNKRLQQVSK